MDESKPRRIKLLIYNPGQQILFDPVPEIFFLTLQCTNKNNIHGDIQTHRQETICHLPWYVSLVTVDFWFYYEHTVVDFLIVPAQGGGLELNDL